MEDDMAEKALEIYNADKENEQPLNKKEEKAYEKNKVDKAQEEIDVLFARVKNIKAAFRKMLNFPETAVEAFNVKVNTLKDTMPLFVAKNDFIRNVSVTFDLKEYQIVIRGVE
jgi:hypothetical protein